MMKLLLGGAALAAIVPAGAQPAPPPPPGVAQGTAPLAPVSGVPQVRVVTRTRGMPMLMMPETRADVVAHAHEVFARLDSNRDGFVSREEAQAAHQVIGADMRGKAEHRIPPMLDRTALFDRLDTNRDGMVSREEFAAPAHAPEMRMHGRLFDRADGNRDGRVSLPELTAAALRHFDLADANHDGRISPDERMRLHEHMRTQKRPA
jgi:Ca2+-binding EF-hand superfamily protein